MPPMQCPMCGRFLKNAFVHGLRANPAACPGCDESLDAGMFDPPVEGPGPSASSVRPPDLRPEAVRDDTTDVLSGWDAGASAADLAAWRADRRPFPTDTVVVAASSAGGAVLGSALDGCHRVRGGFAGATAGLVAAGLARRIWQLRT